MHMHTPTPWQPRPTTTLPQVLSPAEKQRAYANQYDFDHPGTRHLAPTPPTPCPPLLPSLPPPALPFRVASRFSLMLSRPNPCPVVGVLMLFIPPSFRRGTRRRI